LLLREAPLVNEFYEDLLVAIIEDFVFEFVQKFWIFVQGYMAGKLLQTFDVV